jgi:hypothetical protein
MKMTDKQLRSLLHECKPDLKDLVTKISLDVENKAFYMHQAKRLCALALIDTPNEMHHCKQAVEMLLFAIQMMKEEQCKVEKPESKQT